MGHSSDSSCDGDRTSRKRKKRKAKEEKRRSKKCSSSRPAGEREHDAFAQVDMEETDRLLLSLLQLSSEIEAEVFRQLDSGGTVYLQDLGDPRLRKKLRHLFRALLVGEVEGERGRGWRKLSTSEKPLAKFVKRRCKDLRQRVDDTLRLPHVHSAAPAAPSSEQEAGDSVPEFDPEEAERKANEAVLRWRSERAAADREASPQRSLAAEASDGLAQSPVAGVPVELSEGVRFSVPF
ncbi:hypothetical protein Emag_000132 [Eimeria magna]